MEADDNSLVNTEQAKLASNIELAKAGPMNAIASLDAARNAKGTESFSVTAMKMIRRQSKDQLVKQIVAMNNYAENQKAANMMLLYKIDQLNKGLIAAKTELLTFRPEPDIKPEPQPSIPAPAGEPA